MYIPDQSDAWLALTQLAMQNKDDQIADYFAQNPQRHNDMHVKVAGVLLDYSKNKITSEVLFELLKLAESADLSAKRFQMYSGERINVSEQRPVLHTALRNRLSTPVLVDDEDVMPKVTDALAHMQSFCDVVHQGEWLGCTGKQIKHIVNIGIGGSDLGPSFIYQALSDYRYENIEVSFISSVDGAHHRNVLKGLNPEQTLFIISSKSFTTQETMLNAASVKQWFLEHEGIDQSCVPQHFVAVSANVEAVKAFGIAKENIFEFWDWVGGRYSLWSSIGLPIALAIGYQNFEQLLEGAHEIDQHFLAAPFEQNLPVLLALIGIWNINFQGLQSHAVIPYNQSLQDFPAFIQQLDMESNGKTINRNGESINYNTSPIVWGQSGSNGQHAFFQLLHQGSIIAPVDFIASLEQPASTPEHNRALLINMLAQAEAFMIGSQDDSQANFNNCPGNRPSNVLLLDQLSPKNLGALVAIYEHKVFVQGVIWDVNSFDQWGVQLGKKLASNIASQKHSEHDSSTESLLKIVESALQ